MSWDYPIHRGPLFYWRGRWRGKGSKEIEAGEMRAPPPNIVELDVSDYVARERRRGRKWK